MSAPAQAPAARSRSEPDGAVSARTLRGLTLYFLRLGSSGFGGPIALVGYMQRDLVEQRQWFTEQEYRQGLALAQTMPGPLAAQLAMWFGYLQAGALGAAAVAVSFVLPPCLLVTVVAVIYAKYQGLAVVHEILYYGGGLPRRRSPTSAASLSPFALAAAVRGFAWTGSGSALGSMGLFFAKASAFTFGSGLAIVPFLHQGLVHDHHWLTEQQFLDAIAVAMITPGPVVITAAFIGYLVAGLIGGVIAAAAVFAPTPRAPGTPSEGSPRRAMKSGTSAAGTP